MTSKIIIISGACGTGKTSISKLLAEKSASDYAVHFHTDDYYEFIRKGYRSPWEDGTGKQNETVIKAVVASAEQFSLGGYEVYVDGVIGPWFLKSWIALAESGIDVRYVVLRPSEEITVLRAMERLQREAFPLIEANIKSVWHAFASLDKYEMNVIDTTDLTIEESIILIQNKLEEGAFRII